MDLNTGHDKKQYTMESRNALFEYATEGIIISNDRGKIISANPSCGRLFGYKPEELEGMAIDDLVPDRFVKMHEQHRDNYYKSPRPRAMGKGMDLFAKRKDGSEFPIELSLSVYKKEEETFVICFIIDITERKNIEGKMKTLYEDLERKVSERTKVLQEALIELKNSKEQLSAALEQEKELNDMKSRFVTMASHEFRTPLSTILSSVSLIGKYTGPDDNDKRQKHVDRIKSAVTNMTLILNDFLSVGRLDEGEVYANNTRFDIQEQVNEVISELGGLKKTGQAIHYHHEGDEFVILDRQMLRNILINLVSNAIKFSDEGKTVDIQTSVFDNALSLEVKDQGIGIPAEEHKKIFGRFFRAQNVTNIQGTGLGLNIVAKYLEILNGFVKFKSEINEGTTFYITIPFQ